MSTPRIKDLEDEVDRLTDDLESHKRATAACEDQLTAANKRIGELMATQGHLQEYIRIMEQAFAMRLARA